MIDKGVEMKISNLVQALQINKPITIKSIPKGQLSTEESVVVTSKSSTTIYLHPKDTFCELVELLAKAKLAERDYLLVTFFFQKNVNQVYANQFYQLCSPLQEVWTYRILKKYVPVFYHKEIEMNMKYYEYALNQDASILFNQRFLLISLYATLKDYDLIKIDDDIFGIILQNNKDYIKRYILYWDKIMKLKDEEPSSELYLQLPEILNEPYKAKIKKDNEGKYFNLQQLKGKE